MFPEEDRAARRQPKEGLERLLLSPDNGKNG